ncbi:BglG family transcription antiterminator [Breznakia pachnodae]|uniref:Lichenan operon transcriptional antiterminator n=1 Tax=Breznakia pachnodae TaxID=265178 RepID=A0ABU0E7E5_9FIRM|nr:BglG family transcription antiterminator [Breznakia pachnodae]MDQ0362756.1 lichenan operon transcriptional antiterminator [Breznakia pachnodae]
MLSNRQRRIVQILIKNKPLYTSVKELSTELDVSVRTIQKEVQTINDSLKEQAHINNVRNHGYILEGDDSVLMHISKNENTLQDMNEKKARLSSIADYLLNQSDYIRYEDICDEFLVSKSTLSNDIKEIKLKLEEYELFISSKHPLGIKIEGSEFAKRKVLVNLSTIFHSDTVNTVHFKDLDLFEKISEVLIDTLVKEEYKISDVVLQNIIMHIYISVERMRSGNYLKINIEDSNFDMSSNEVHIAKNILEILANEFVFQVEESEIVNLAINIQAKKNHYNPDFITDEINDDVLEILKRINSTWHIDLADDIELRVSLALHLMPLKLRMMQSIQLENELEKEIKQSFSLAYEFAVVASSYMEEITGKSMSLGELSYLTVHFSLAVEKRDFDIEKKSILLISSSRRGDSLLFTYRLRRWFPEMISEIDIRNVYELPALDISKYDVIFTTVNESELIPDDAVYINYFLSEQDHHQIEKVLTGLSTRQNIMKYFSENLFFNDVESREYDEVLKELCERVTNIKKDVFTSELYPAVLRREKLGYTTFGNLIAMPHPDGLITTETFVSVCILEEPIDWAQEKVQLIFLTCNEETDQKELRALFDFLSRLIIDKESVDLIIKDRTYANFIKLLKRKV